MSASAFAPAEAYFTDSPYGFLNYSRGIREQERSYEGQRLMQESAEEVQREGLAQGQEQFEASLSQQESEFARILEENALRRISSERDASFRRTLATRQQGMIEKYAKIDRETTAAAQSAMLRMEDKRMALAELEQREGSEARAETLRLRAELQKDQDEYNDEQQRLYREQFTFYQEIQKADLSLKEEISRGELELGRGRLDLESELGRGQLDLGERQLEQLSSYRTGVLGLEGRGLDIREEQYESSLDFSRQQFREQQSQFDITFKEGQRQYNQTFEENRYRYDQSQKGSLTGGAYTGAYNEAPYYDWGASFTGRRSMVTAQETGQQAWEYGIGGKLRLVSGGRG